MDECALKFHHVGVVVANAEAASKQYCAIMNIDSALIESELVESNSVKVSFVPLADNSQIEFIEPIGELSPVFRFLNKGGGLHHICYETPYFETALQYLKRYAKVISGIFIGLECRRACFLFFRDGIMGFRLIELLDMKS